MSAFGNRIDDIIAERDRLRSINAELLAALKAIDEVSCKHQRGAIGLAQDIARSVLARAEAEG